MLLIKGVLFVNSIAIMGILPVIIYLGMLVYGVYAVLAILKSAKQRNEYLKEIRDELRKKI